MLHDGPKIYDVDYPVIYTEERANVWGHNLRDIGIKMAKGKYNLHTNCDTV